MNRVMVQTNSDHAQNLRNNGLRRRPASGNFGTKVVHSTFPDNIAGTFYVTDRVLILNSLFSIVL